MSQSRGKFVPPRLECKLPPINKQRTPLRVDTADFDSPYRTSQAYSVKSLLGGAVTVETPALRDMLIAKRPNLDRSGRQYDVSVYETSPKPSRFKETATYTRSQEQNEEDAIGDDKYTFPSSPVAESHNLVKRSSRKAKQAANRGLLLFVRKTLAEIEEIRRKRKILREHGLNGLKQFVNGKLL